MQKSELCVANCAWEWKHVADVLYTCEVHYKSLEAQTEAGMLCATVLAEFQVPPVVLGVQAKFVKRLISCEYNFDNCCVELKFTDGSMIAIDTIAVENEVARNMYERSELDYLIYNAPLEYADLILNGDPETYLKTVTEYKPLD